MSSGFRKYNVLVTRPAHQAENLSILIEQQGWNALRFPTLEIAAVNNQLIQKQLEDIEQWQWLIFISANAVNFAIQANNGKIDNFKGLSIAAVGKATEKALSVAGLSVDLLPEHEFNTEGLLATNEMKQISGKACLIVRGKGGREVLAETLKNRGAKVDYMEVYTRRAPVCINTNIYDLLRDGKLDAITVTSGDALSNLLKMVGAELKAKLISVPLIVISNRIKELAEQYKFKQIAVTEKPGDTAIIETLMMSLTH